MIFSRPLIVLDTETTGLPKDPDAQPWEIAAVLYDVDGIEQGAFSAMGCPAIFREPMRRIIALGGVDPKMVLGSDPLAFGIADFRSWLALSPDARCTAFNVAFDRPMLQRVGVEVEAWAPCIMERAKKQMGAAGSLPWLDWASDWKMPKLSEAADFYGVPQQEPAHRALADARTAGLIAVEMAKRAQEKTHAYT